MTSSLSDWSMGGYINSNLDIESLSLLLAPEEAKPTGWSLKYCSLFETILKKSKLEL